MDGDGGEEGEDLKEEEGMEVDPVVLVTEAAPDAAEQGSQALEEEWDDEVFEALEHAAKNAATGWWNLKGLQKAVATLLARKPTWEQALDWILDEARRFPTPLGSFFRTEALRARSPTET